MNTPQKKPASAEALLNLALKLSSKAARIRETSQVRVMAKDADGNVVAVLLFASGPSAAELWEIFEVAEEDLVDGATAELDNLDGLEPDPIEIGDPELDANDDDA